jgi:hypothetical protein
MAAGMCLRATRARKSGVAVTFCPGKTGRQKSAKAPMIDCSFLPFVPLRVMPQFEFNAEGVGQFQPGVRA